MHIYKAYQLNIRTDFPIPEFPPGDETGALENATGKGVLYQATARQFLLNGHVFVEG